VVAVGESVTVGVCVFGRGTGEGVDVDAGVGGDCMGISSEGDELQAVMCKIVNASTRIAFCIASTPGIQSCVSLAYVHLFYLQWIN